MISTRRITVDGLSTSVLVGRNGIPGEAVVFVHGNPDSGSDWMPLMTRIVAFTAAFALVFSILAVLATSLISSVLPNVFAIG